LRKIIIVILALVLVTTLAVGIAINVPASQNFLLGRLMATMMTATPNQFDGMRAIVCGSASPLGNDPDRAQACIAIVTPEHLFLFDIGAGSPRRLQEAGLPLSRLDAVFLTHFHSDHIAGLPEVNLNSRVLGRTGHLQVIGPKGAGKVVAGFNLAYQLDTDYRIAHHGIELLPRDGAEMQAQEIETGVIWQDDLVKVTAFAVDHTPISPAVGYRIDYRGRSVVISGDTIAVDSLFSAANNADLLFHDALSPSIMRIFIDVAKNAGRPRLAAIFGDVTDYHADMTKLEAMSEAAGIDQLVLYHMVPVPGNRLIENMFERDIGSNTLLAKDLMTFDLPTGSSDIVVSEL
jgi:ribonuclease Z